MVSLCLVSYKMNVRLDWLVILTTLRVLYMKQLPEGLVSLCHQFLFTKDTLHGKKSSIICPNIDLLLQLVIIYSVNHVHLYCADFVLTIKGGRPLSYHVASYTNCNSPGIM